MAVTGDGDRPSFRRGLQLATRSAVAATLAFSIAQALKLDYPIFALAAAVIATDLTPARSRELGFRRLVATAIGGLSGALAASMHLVGIWAVAPSILIAMLICQGVGA
ncbi:MAG: aromatic acid exporter family protein, partial [Microvirga sp.]